MSKRIQCEDLEELMYLKQDELSVDENEILQDHLSNCEKCRKQYQDILLFMQQAEYETQAIDSRFLEARVMETHEKHQDKRINTRFNPVRRRILKALSIASVFFFVIYSIEQVNTVKKISGLEQKLDVSNGTSLSPKGQILVLNHFYDMDDLKQIINPDNNYQEIPGSIFLTKNLKRLNINLLSLKDRKKVMQILESNSVGKGILNRGYYGNPNLLNLSLD